MLFLLNQFIITIIWTKSQTNAKLNILKKYGILKLVSKVEVDMTKAIYMGSFDPVTNGHLDIILRASKMFDELVVLVSNNINKKYLLPLNIRKKILENIVEEYRNIKVDVYEGLVIEYAQENDINILIRSMRNTVDFEQELTLAFFNKELSGGIETVLLIPNEKYRFVSSSSIKELLHYKKDISKYVPKEVLPYLK